MQPGTVTTGTSTSEFTSCLTTSTSSTSDSRSSTGPSSILNASPPRIQYTAQTPGSQEPSRRARDSLAHPKSKIAHPSRSSGRLGVLARQEEAGYDGRRAAAAQAAARHSKGRRVTRGH
ncbi:hypothetical protein GALMADRAFT_455224 [Galerina marginata CBS 339.88]|uniref:Uncharacterized protein n=1 Tax=Galerina marginata (strain CBS 339.88) TaxID=685588 RepID=A0A067TAA7_GALM3|nr:hypothetical protein GALMADRAFT_455224 [Galerina marginata CBS 339.88]